VTEQQEAERGHTMSEIDVKEGETNAEFVKRRADMIDAEELCEKLMRHLHKTAKRKHVPLWSVIGQVTSHGSGISYAITKRFVPEYQGD
jgi:hypothetical protein